MKMAVPAEPGLLRGVGAESLGVGAGDDRGFIRVSVSGL
jgi:hypothetical protein